MGLLKSKWNPYVKGGTLAWDELSGTGGHKSLVALGFNSLAAFGRLRAGFNFEKWWVAERLDDDKGIIPDGGTAFSPTPATRSVQPKCFACIRSLASDTNISRIGVTADAGFRLFNCMLGIFFRSVGFENPDAKMVQAGVMFGYTFK